MTQPDPLDLENHFFIKQNQLKAVGDLLSAVRRDLREDTLNYAGDLIVDLTDELSHDFEMVFDKLLKGEEL